MEQPAVKVTYLGERCLADVRNHRQCRDHLLLDISLRRLPYRTGVEELEQPVDDGVKVRYKRIVLSAFAEIDDR